MAARQGQPFKAQAQRSDSSRQARQNLFGDFSRTTFVWEGVNAGLVLDGIIAVLNAGDAVTLSLTADGGAVKLTLWRDNVKHVGYAATDDQLHELCEAMMPVQPSAEVPPDFKPTQGLGR